MAVIPLLVVVVATAGCLRQGQYAYRDAPKAANTAGLRGMVTHVQRERQRLFLNLELHNAGDRQITVGTGPVLQRSFHVHIGTRRDIVVAAVTDAGNRQVITTPIRLVPGQKVTVQLRWAFRPPLSRSRYRWDLVIDGIAAGDAPAETLTFTGTAPPCYCPWDEEETETGPEPGTPTPAGDDG